MPDVYAHIAEADVEVQQKLVAVMELRAADPQQAEMRDAFLRDIVLPKGAHVLEFGCGPGIVARTIAARPDVDTSAGQSR